MLKFLSIGFFQGWTREFWVYCNLMRNNISQLLSYSVALNYSVVVNCWTQNFSYFHSVHVQSRIGFGIINPFLWILSVISSEKSFLNAMPLLLVVPYIDIRTKQFFCLLNPFWSIQMLYTRAHQPNHICASVWKVTDKNSMIWIFFTTYLFLCLSFFVVLPFPSSSFPRQQHLLHLFPHAVPHVLSCVPLFS